MGVPFIRGDIIRISSYSSVAVFFSLQANIRRLDGTVDTYNLGRNHPTGSGRTLATTDGGVLGKPGFI